jgi:putative CocE/NonD family hydrolase
VASWADQGLHTRGTLEAYRRMSSKQKWLEVHGQKKWANYYRPESREKQRQFFDHFLKGTDDRVLSWPAVQIEVRERANVSRVRTEKEWPLARTQYRPLFLDASGSSLRDTKPASAAQVRYDALKGSAHFDYKFERDTEVTGYASLHLWVEAEGSTDMDLFVALQKLDRDGQPVGFVFYAFYENGPIALGWLRASHRELDAARSTPWQPVHPHTREQPLEPGKPVAVDIEIWPSSTSFAAGETLRVLIQGRDIYTDALPNLPFARHEELRNQGTHILHAGGEFDSHLLVPFIP